MFYHQVKRQRYQYKLKVVLGKKSNLTQDRIDALNKLDFMWNSHDSVWLSRFHELQQYAQDNNGSVLVPSTYPSNPGLSIWVKRQRRQYLFRNNGTRSHTMTEYRLNALNSINFSWVGTKTGKQRK